MEYIIDNGKKGFSLVKDKTFSYVPFREIDLYKILNTNGKVAHQINEEDLERLYNGELMRYYNTILDGEIAEANNRIERAMKRVKRYQATVERLEKLRV